MQGDAVVRDRREANRALVRLAAERAPVAGDCLLPALRDLDPGGAVVRMAEERLHHRQRARCQLLHPRRPALFAGEVADDERHIAARERHRRFDAGQGVHQRQLHLSGDLDVRGAAALVRPVRRSRAGERFDDRRPGRVIRRHDVHRRRVTADDRGQEDVRWRHQQPFGARLRQLVAERERVSLAVVQRAAERDGRQFGRPLGCSLYINDKRAAVRVGGLQIARAAQDGQ